MTLHDLLPLVSPYVVNCPDGVQAAAIRSAASEFLGDSRVWARTLEAHDGDGAWVIHSLGALVALAELDPAAEVVQVNAVRVDGRTISDWHTIEGGTALALARPPADGAEVEVDVVLTAGPTVQELPADMVARYSAAIAAKALFLIRSIDRRPYTDPTGAATAQQTYLGHLHKANIDRVTGKDGRTEAHTNPQPDYF